MHDFEFQFEERKRGVSQSAAGRVPRGRKPRGGGAPGQRPRGVGAWAEGSEVGGKGAVDGKACARSRKVGPVWAGGGARESRGSTQGDACVRGWGEGVRGRCSNRGDRRSSPTRERAIPAWGCGQHGTTWPGCCANAGFKLAAPRGGQAHEGGGSLPGQHPKGIGVWAERSEAGGEEGRRRESSVLGAVGVGPG